MLLHIHHRTRYSYASPRHRLVQSLRLTPSVCAGQKVLDWNVQLEGATIGAGFTDGAGDYVQTLSLTGSFTEVELLVEGHVETTDTHGILTGHAETVSPLVYLRETPLTACDSALRKLAKKAAKGFQAGSLELAHSLCNHVRDAIAYQSGTTDHHYTAAQALAAGVGVCQDHTHTLIAIARANGYPARYVVGYLHADADGNSHEASHAWAELHIDGLGWVGFDATNGICPNEGYLRLGSGLNAHDAAPIRGVAFGGSGGETMKVQVTVADSAQ
jgi:transglutaminase-like putative cysteine protease